MRLFRLKVLNPRELAMRTALKAGVRFYEWISKHEMLVLAQDEWAARHLACSHENHAHWWLHTEDVGCCEVAANVPGVVAWW